MKYFILKVYKYLKLFKVQGNTELWTLESRDSTDADEVLLMVVVDSFPFWVIIFL